MKIRFALLRCMMRPSLLVPLLLYAAARFAVPYRKGVCESTRRALVVNKFLFDGMCRCISRDMSSGKAALARALARAAARFTSRRMTGYYSSPALEAPFLQLAEALPMPDVPAAPAGSLHVMTQAYSSGGHTQLVRRWMELLPEKPHHLLLTAQGNFPLPSDLQELVNASGGTFTRIADAMPEAEAGMLLRTCALQARHVVLHTHMHDPLPIIAFGRKDFPRPVVLMNHADHKFWLCRSVTDHVLEMREEGRALTRLYRGNPPATVVSIPLAPQEQRDMCGIGREAARRELGVPPNIPVLLTVATPYKYTPIAPYDMRMVIRGCLNALPDCQYLVGGPQADEPFWKSQLVQSQGRLKVLGPLSRKALRQCFAAADVYVDSVPLGGGMTCLDAAQSGLPVVTHNVYRQAISFIRRSGVEFESSQQLVREVARLLASLRLREELAGVQRTLMAREHEPLTWAERVRDCLRNCQSHSVVSAWPQQSVLGDYQIFLNCIEP